MEKSFECDDAISREDVLREIIRFSTEEGASVECQQLYCDVNNMPSVTHKSGKCEVNEDKEEQLKKLKAELDYAKFRCTL